MYILINSSLKRKVENDRDCKILVFSEELNNEVAALRCDEPDCNRPVSVVMYKYRSLWFSDSERYSVEIPVVYCEHCHRYHVVLPKGILPYKRYAACVIQDVIADVVDEYAGKAPYTPEDIHRSMDPLFGQHPDQSSVSDDGSLHPCREVQFIWRRQFRQSCNSIDSILRRCIDGNDRIKSFLGNPYSQNPLKVLIRTFTDWISRALSAVCHYSYITEYLNSIKKAGIPPAEL